MLQRAPQPIEAPDHQGVAGADIAEGLVESRPVGPGAGEDVPEDLVTAGGGQGVQLQVEGLVPGRDPGVAKQHRGVFL